MSVADPLNSVPLAQLKRRDASRGAEKLMVDL
jgi:hypothetical protein